MDWATYANIDIAEAPDSVEIVLIDRPDMLLQGAGEPAPRPVAAAIANAVALAPSRRGPPQPSGRAMT